MEQLIKTQHSLNIKPPGVIAASGSSFLTPSNLFLWFLSDVAFPRPALDDTSSHESSMSKHSKVSASFDN